MVFSKGEVGRKLRLFLLMVNGGLDLAGHF